MLSVIITFSVRLLFLGFACIYLVVRVANYLVVWRSSTHLFFEYFSFIVNNILPLACCDFTVIYTKNRI